MIRDMNCRRKNWCPLSTKWQARLKLWHQTIERWQSKSEIRTLVAILRWVFMASIVGLLFWRLNEIGWANVLANLPSQPLFYLFFMIRFFALPITETITYGRIFGHFSWGMFPVFMRKRVYNASVLGYSGEAFLIIWARRKLNLGFAGAAAKVKDGNILSAFAANLMTLGILGWLIVSGIDRQIDFRTTIPIPLIPLAMMFAGGAVVLVIVFFRRLVGMPIAEAGLISLAHLCRQIIQSLALAGMILIAVPGAGSSVVLIIVGLYLAITRIPFLPGQELVFLGAALSLAPLSGLNEASLAGVLVVDAALTLLLGFVVFVATTPLVEGPDLKGYASSNEGQ